MTSMHFYASTKLHRHKVTQSKTDLHTRPFTLTIARNRPSQYKCDFRLIVGDAEQDTTGVDTTKFPTRFGATIRGVQTDAGVAPYMSTEAYSVLVGPVPTLLKKCATVDIRDNVLAKELCQHECQMSPHCKAIVYVGFLLGLLGPLGLLGSCHLD